MRYYGELLATQFDQPGEAKHWMEKSIILDPTFAAGHNSYAQLLFKHFEEVKTARKHYNKAIGRYSFSKIISMLSWELNPLNLIYHENLVYLLETINDLDAIRSHWNHWISEFPSNVTFCWLHMQRFFYLLPYYFTKSSKKLKVKNKVKKNLKSKNKVKKTQSQKIK